MELATELDALNTILGATGEQPVNTLDSGLPDAMMALRLLRSNTRAAQALGWWFNREYGVRLNPASGQTITAVGLLDLQPAGDDARRHLILRGTRLFDGDTHSYTFDRDVTVDVTRSLTWDDLPDIFREYVTIRAARVWQDNTSKSEALHKFKAVDEQMAWDTLVATNTRNVRATSPGRPISLSEAKTDDSGEIAAFIDEAAVSFQAQGWWFNTDPSGEILIQNYDALPRLVQDHIRATARRQYHESRSQTQPETLKALVKDEAGTLRLVMSEHVRALRVDSYGGRPLVLDVNGVPRAEDLADFIEAADIETQAEGWWFNRRRGQRFVPDGAGLITLGDDVLEVRTTRGRTGVPLAVVDGRLYSPTEDRDVFAEPMVVDVTRRVRWDATPAIYQAYVKALARRQYHALMDASAKTQTAMVADEAQARAALRAAHIRNAAANSNTGSYSVFRTLNRRHNP